MRDLGDVGKAIAADENVAEGEQQLKSFDSEESAIEG